jgi:hypothetical protein
VALALAGCPASQTWTTARTVTPGRVAHALGVDFVGVTIEDRTVAGETTIDDPGLVGIPFLGYVFRYGVTAGLDAGLKVSSTGAFAIDAKVQLLRGRTLALALDPGALAPFRFEYVYLNLPILLSLEAGSGFTVTLYPKSSYVLVIDEETDNAIDGLLVGGGMHVQIRILPAFAVTPAVEVLVLGWGEDRTATVIDFGLGFSFGALPEDDDERREERAEGLL